MLLSLIASSSLFKTTKPAPSPITKPSAFSSKGLEPFADKAPILQNLTKEEISIDLSAPPVKTTSNSFDMSELTEVSKAAILDAQAASVVIDLPVRLKVLAILPAITFESSPGIESSVIDGNFSL